METLLGISITLILAGGLIKLEEFLNPTEESIEDFVTNNLVCGRTIPGPPPLDEQFYKKDKDVTVEYN